MILGLLLVRHHRTKAKETAEEAVGDLSVVYKIIFSYILHM